MNPEVESALVEFDRLERELLDLGGRIIQAYGGHVYALDLLANAALKRTLSLNSAFASLLRENNYLAAAHLVRLSLDSVLRLSAAWIVADCQQFATSVLNGISIRKLKDKKGVRLTDAYLASILTKDFPWVQRVYDATSGYIHLSDKHVYNTFSPSDQPNKISILISKTSDTIRDANRLEAIEAMTAITRLLMHYLEGWRATKDNPPSKAQQDAAANP